MPKKKVEQKPSQKQQTEAQPKKKRVAKKNPAKREIQRKQALGKLRNNLFTFLDKRPKYIILGSIENWIVLTKMVNLNICHTANAEGFQPLERTEQCNKWVVALVNLCDHHLHLRSLGKDASIYWGPVKELFDSGCPIIVIRSRDEIEKKLGEI